MKERKLTLEQFVSLSMVGSCDFLTYIPNEWPVGSAIRLFCPVVLSGKNRVLELFGVVDHFSFNVFDPVTLRMRYYVFVNVEYSDRVTYINLFSELGYRYESYNSPII